MSLVKLVMTVEAVDDGEAGGVVAATVVDAVVGMNAVADVVPHHSQPLTANSSQRCGQVAVAVVVVAASMVSSGVGVVQL
mmetsp:Transcript_9167/g.20709  ORF Transcript_9167/g.20709 Transcript_9167/m.20709 type:complete len:80 (-) Transcript_9167:1655-1894(-)